MEEEKDTYETLAEYDKELITKSLIHQFNDTNSIKDLDKTIIEIALTKGCRPLGIF